MEIVAVKIVVLDAIGLVKVLVLENAAAHVEVTVKVLVLQVVRLLVPMGLDGINLKEKK